MERRARTLVLKSWAQVWATSPTWHLDTLCGENHSFFTGLDAQ